MPGESAFDVADKFHRPVILIVDDQPDNLALLCSMLEGDYQVRAVTSGAAALSAATHAPIPDLVILDVMMPGMDGYETLRRLRQIDNLREVPVMFATALAAEEDEELGLDLGAADYVTKPLRPGVVRARVKVQIEAHLARRWLRDRAGELEREVQRRLHDFYLVQDVALRALAGLAETRDNETGNHILRTQGYVAILGGALARDPRYAAALTPERLEQIIKAAPLHDIGKVGIPDRILLKPGKLTDEEFAVMRTHAQLGADAIERAMRDAVAEVDMTNSSAEGSPSQLAFLVAARDIAGGHHERWDGTGYPKGLAGEAIPLAARLMALADVFDALISRRVYKEPYPLEQVIALIDEGDGRHFDPQVAAAFRATLPEFVAIAERHKDQ